MGLEMRSVRESRLDCDGTVHRIQHCVMLNSLMMLTNGNTAEEGFCETRHVASRR